MLKNPGVERPSITSPVNDAAAVDLSGAVLAAPPKYTLGQKVATREAYGSALAKLATSHSKVVALDGDMKNSTFSQNIKKVDENRYIECFICEQNLIGVGIGVAYRDRTIAFASTFACFLTRAFDNLRMGVISQTNLNVMGSHCGVSIGEDGPSQMALEDLAMMRSLPGCTIFYPSDAVACERAVELAANTKGITFIRLNRPATPIIYENDFQFKVGKANVVKSSSDDKVLLIGAGVTLEQAMIAAKTLEASGVNVRVMDPFTIKPLDEEAILKNARECGGKIVAVEDHYPEGGLCSAVADVAARTRDVVLKSLSVREMPRSGPPKVLIQKYGIGANSIVSAVQDIMKE